MQPKNRAAGFAQRRIIIVIRLFYSRRSQGSTACAHRLVRSDFVILAVLPQTARPCQYHTGTSTSPPAQG